MFVLCIFSEIYACNNQKTVKTRLKLESRYSLSGCIKLMQTTRFALLQLANLFLFFFLGKYLIMRNEIYLIMKFTHQN